MAYLLAAEPLVECRLKFPAAFVDLAQLVTPSVENPLLAHVKIMDERLQAAQPSVERAPFRLGLGLKDHIFKSSKANYGEVPRAGLFLLKHQIANRRLPVPVDIGFLDTENGGGLTGGCGDQRRWNVGRSMLTDDRGALLSEFGLILSGKVAGA